MKRSYKNDLFFKSLETFQGSPSSENSQILLPWTVHTLLFHYSIGLTKHFLAKLQESGKN